MKREAIVLLSGGLDSTTVLAIAKDRGFECRTLSFDYGQRHRFELEAAARVAQRYGSLEHVVFRIDMTPIGGSALTDSIDVPKNRDTEQMTATIPVTYVPARNSVFLAIAAALAEARDIHDIFIGVNALDYSGYPDCRPEFIAAMEQALTLGTACGVADAPIRLHAPLIDLSKAEIVALGTDLQVDYTTTHSCYDPDANGTACGHCDSCTLRRRGFADAGLRDPTRYQTA